MSSFYSDPAVGGDGSTTTDDESPTTGLKNYGWTTRLVPALAQIVAIATWVKSTALTVAGYVSAAAGSATAAAASAATALSAPGTAATSSTVLSIATGSASLTIQTGKALVSGMPVMIALATNPTGFWMYGQISSYNSSSGALVVNVTGVSGSGSSGNWLVFLIGPQGPTGATGTTDFNGLINKPATYPATPRQLAVIATNTAAVAGTDYVMTASLTLTLPASPTAGDIIGVINRSGTTTCVVGRNGKKIESLAEDMTMETIDAAKASFSLEYVDATRGWVIR